MAGRLEGKVCVITGAGGGMGADAAVRFAEEGALVAVADVDGDAAEKVAGEVAGLAVQVDVSDEASVQRMYLSASGHFGGIDVLYNNAGISPADDASILETDLDAWERVQAVNTQGVYLCCKHGISHLLERGGATAGPPADGADGEAARDRQRRALPRERRVELRERGDVRRRRRPKRRLRHTPVDR